MCAMVFDIQRSSFVDGPGIRTTVFFKGCNLKCAWCHNPESQCYEPQMMHYKQKCTACGKCLQVCPHHGKTCERCGRCVLLCPNGARALCGKEMSADEMIAEIVKDRLFFEASGGGVTFSGGECMLQIDALAEILHLCKQEGIHTAVDTAGAVEWARFERILPDTDLFLYDVKSVSEELHRAGTGVSNRLILENLRKLSEQTDAEVIVRIPVIGGFNDTVEEMQSIADFLSTVRVRQIELLPYHAMGEHKYEALGRLYERGCEPPEARMEQYRAMMKKVERGNNNV